MHCTLIYDSVLESLLVLLETPIGRFYARKDYDVEEDDEVLDLREIFLMYLVVANG